MKNEMGFTRVTTPEMEYRSLSPDENKMKTFSLCSTFVATSLTFTNTISKTTYSHPACTMKSYYRSEQRVIIFYGFVPGHPLFHRFLWGIEIVLCDFNSIR